MGIAHTPTSGTVPSDQFPPGGGPQSPDTAGVSFEGTPLPTGQLGSPLFEAAIAPGQPVPSIELARFAAVAAGFLRGLHIRGNLLPLLREVTVERRLLRRAERFGLEVTDNELQSAADVFRWCRGLTSMEETRLWLESERLTVSDFEDALRRDLLLEKLCDHVTRGQVPQHFDTHRANYDSAHLRHVVVDNEEQARQLQAEAQENGRDFAEISRAHSLDSVSTSRGGDLGRVFRSEMSPAVAHAVFNARPNHVVGPIPDQQGYGLFLVETIEPAQLDDVTVRKIRKELFSVWVAEQADSDRIDPDLLSLI